ncbi:Dicer-like protein 1 [Arachnomyces sp. PD_36]|nr:Dicer-like protein 1 [Arachnomyces sp. PD_36]
MSAPMGAGGTTGGLGTNGTGRSRATEIMDQALEQAAEQLSLSSDSDDDAEVTTTHATTTQRRRLQNAKFDALLSSHAESSTKEEINNAIKAVKDSELSTQNLIAKQDFAAVINDPREYQIELFERAKTQNIIAVLDTGTFIPTPAPWFIADKDIGSGKTLIAVLLLKHMIKNELIDRGSGKPHRISFFLVDSVTLVFQQSAVLQHNIDQNIGRFCGAMGTDYWSRETWQEHLRKNMVIVCTAEILYQCLMHSFVRIDQINLLIFDEAHHTKKQHPYARIIKEAYFREPDVSKRPKIFGMTASPVDAKSDVVRTASMLETLLDSQIATASDLALLRKSVARPREELWIYERLLQPFETDLYNNLKTRFGDIENLESLFRFSYEASSNLGRWCSDWVWSYGLSEEEFPKLEGRVERKYFGKNRESNPRAQDEVKRLRQAREIIRKHQFPELIDLADQLSPKVLHLFQELSRYYETPTDTKCIVFTKERLTAKLLEDLFGRIGSHHLHAGVLIGTGSSDYGGTNVSVREQVLTLMKFRNGELNCLFATSVAEEGLDIPDCNLVVRFDLYSTLIQYIQSRGRARHANSTYVHMVERDNLIHKTSIENVRTSEVLLRQFCQSLPKDRLLKGNDCDLESVLEKEQSKKIFEVPKTGAKLTYATALTVLAHYASTLQYEKEISAQVTYIVLPINDAFVCEVILPEKSPIRGLTGMPASQKALAKQSAAFETCLVLRKNGLLDDYFISTYHKRLPVMRNARLAIKSKKTNQFDMIQKPKFWEEGRGTIPEKLYATIITLNPSAQLKKDHHPLVLLTRGALPQIPSFPLFLEDDIETEARCISVEQSMSINEDELGLLTTFTLRIFEDVFHKIYQREPEIMPYWIVPASQTQKQPSPDVNLRELIDWNQLQIVEDNEELEWSADMPDEFFANRFVFDKWDGSRRYFTTRVEPSLRPSDPPPDGAPRRRHMENILGYCLSAFKNTRVKFFQNCNWEQPVILAELAPLRRNLLDRMNAKEKAVETKCYICVEPLKISAISSGFAASCFAFPALISRIESYMVALDACESLNLKVTTLLALEALTKDSDNTEEHRNEQIHFQRGMGKNYERLEFLGDCFLKMATSISLFAKNPDNDEYDFHVKRMCLICNQNLLNTAVSKKIYEYIRSRGFSRRLWYPEGLNLLQGKGPSKTDASENKHALADKTIADVCEALIGASLLSGGEEHRFDMAVRAVTALVNSTDHDVLSWKEYLGLYSLPQYQIEKADASEIELAEQVERKLRYRFKYPRLLRSAFTHPSYPSAWAKVPCYQRLEFLGDSLLDMACVEYLFERHPDRDPQWLTEHKMAMVSNKFLGAVAAKLALGGHLQMLSGPLQGQIKTYMEEIDEVEKESPGMRDYWVLTSDPPKVIPEHGA